MKRSRKTHMERVRKKSGEKCSGGKVFCNSL